MGILSSIFSSNHKSIYTAIRKGYIDDIRDYLNGSNNLNSDFQLQSILHYAIDNCENNYFETIKLLMNSGIDINSHHSKFLETPLHKLCARAVPHIDIITILLEKGAKVNAVNISGKTPVFYCNFSYSVELLNLLIKYGADINIQDKYKNTLLHDDYVNCLDEHFEEFLKTLLNLGFDINSKNDLGLTPLALCKNEKIEGILVNYGAFK
ncbi:ankyrin repeat domain-containing protein [Clostridium sp. JS66]|uniref:ankyrin repeat domain-containing protein n=1 Tax=Clostridium sp. JS66 TaxID=3064705 RepID=UPI00298DDB6B|nr:ankyrin repeat domain-containing protein [Clostridium sp. JS66]WPC44227.1 ankyrin repeat domain-containing protein [Clostridium sp. JS66]